MRGRVLLAAALLVQLAFAQKGEYIGIYPWNSDQLQWAKDFRIVELGSFGDIDRIDISDYETPITYQWLAGFYEDQASEFDRWVLEKGYILNPKGHILDEGDYYYDMCNEELRERRINYLVQECEQRGLKGIFFDWGNEEFLNEPEFKEVKAYFELIHPDTSYKECIRDFYEKLRQKGLLIVSNQAFRNPILLDAVDLDMSESYISTANERQEPITIEGQRYETTPYTVYFPLGPSIHDTYTYLKELDELVQEHKVQQMVYNNYAAPKLVESPSGYEAKTPREVIHYNYAFAKLFQAICYTEVPFDRSLEQDAIYFTKDLGAPKGEIERFDWGYRREFEKGFVLVSQEDLTLDLDRRVYDTFLQEWVGPGPYEIKRGYDRIAKSHIPIGRIFLYEEQEEKREHGTPFYKRPMEWMEHFPLSPIKHRFPRW
ncbi:MAG: hypothetical protein C6I00_07660 [Nitratiruptor sp.]|nr:hypothetical protein [Nitratiruptor sp.]NPA82967.1 hypothetical protein [Campylobacterota bacterium]